MNRLLAAIASQPARTRRITGACATRRTVMGEGFSAAALWGFPKKPSEGDGFLIPAPARVHVSWSSPGASL